MFHDKPGESSRAKSKAGIIHQKCNIKTINKERNIFVTGFSKKAHNITCTYNPFARITLLLSKIIIATWEANPQFILKLEL